MLPPTAERPMRCRRHRLIFFLRHLSDTSDAIRYDIKDVILIGWMGDASDRVFRLGEGLRRTRANGWMDGGKHARVGASTAFNLR